MPRRNMYVPEPEDLSIFRILSSLSLLMKALKITSRQLAEDLGAATRTINNWRTSQQIPGREKWRIGLRSYLLHSARQQGIDLAGLLNDLESEERGRRLAERIRQDEEAAKNLREEEQKRVAEAQAKRLEKANQKAETPALPQPVKEVVKTVEVPVQCSRMHSRVVESLARSVGSLCGSQYSGRATTLERIVAKIGEWGFIPLHQETNFAFWQKFKTDLIYELLFMNGMKPDERQVIRLGLTAAPIPLASNTPLPITKESDAADILTGL